MKTGWQGAKQWKEKEVLRIHTEVVEPDPEIVEKLNAALFGERVRCVWTV
jgi:hypothetical protein